jgi:hypothetical protein
MLPGASSSRSAALSKLAKAARLSAEAAKLYAEAAEVLAGDGQETPPPAITEVDTARARRALKKAGVRI